MQVVPESLILRSTKGDSLIDPFTICSGGETARVSITFLLKDKFLFGVYCRAERSFILIDERKLITQ